jgi:Na+-translocating ferredoxin:NAD+ oxidoreductase subunit D
MTDPHGNGERMTVSTPAPATSEAPVVSLHVAPSPHLCNLAYTTRGMMIDVLIALIPVLAMAVYVFQWYAVVQITLCVLTCLATEAVCCLLRRRPLSLMDGSAAITGLILGLSLPWSSPWYVTTLAGVVAIGLGKAVFGGLGYNLFNPAMVGRAFVMLSFAKELGAGAYVVTRSNLMVLTEATPLTIAKQFAADLVAGRVISAEMYVQLAQAERVWPLLIGQVNGSLGETSALALLIGGVYLCLRRSASWEIPTGILCSAFLAAALSRWTDLTPFTALRHLISGSLLFGAFFVATDPVTSPLTPLGKFLFGLGIGALTIIIRMFSGYPEGMMFAVLLMNATVPLINTWTIPKPLGYVPAHSA